MFERRFFGNAPLAQLEGACTEIEKKKTASLVKIEGRNASLPDGSPSKVNVVQFDPKDDHSEVKDDLTLVLKDDADPAFFGRMASEGKQQIGDHDGMNVFILDEPKVILVFGKTTSVILDIN